MTNTKTLMLAAVAALSLGIGSAMAQEEPRRRGREQPAGLPRSRTAASRRPTAGGFVRR